MYVFDVLLYILESTLQLKYDLSTGIKQKSKIDFFGRRKSEEKANEFTGSDERKRRVRAAHW
jgi:hypothetical protein